MTRDDPRVMRGVPAGGYGVNGRTGRYQGPGPVQRELETPCPWCGAGVWDDCVERPKGVQHPLGMCYSRIAAHNEKHPDCWETTP